MLASFLSVALLLAQGNALNLNLREPHDVTTTYTSSQAAANYTSVPASANYTSVPATANYTSVPAATNYTVTYGGGATSYAGATSTRYITASTASTYSCWYEYASTAAPPAATSYPYSNGSVTSDAFPTDSAVTSDAFPTATVTATPIFSITTTITDSFPSDPSATSLPPPVNVTVSTPAGGAPTSTVSASSYYSAPPHANYTSRASGHPTKFGNQTVHPTNFPGDVNGTLVCIVPPNFNGTFNHTSEQLNSGKTGAGVKFEASAGTAAFAVVLAAVASLL